MYKIIKSGDYQLHKQNYLKLISEMFKDDNDKLANIQEITEHLNFIFHNNLNSFLILQLDNDELISMINGYEYSDKQWCLFSLFTKKEYRRRGYAKKILELAIEEIKKYDYSMIIVGIEEDNISSIKLHEKLGFKYANCDWNDLADGFPENHLGFIYDRR